MVTSVPEPAIAKLFSSWPSRIALGTADKRVVVTCVDLARTCPLPSVCVPGANQ